MDLNKLALLNSIAQEKAELEKKSELIKKEIDFIEYTKEYTKIIEGIIYDTARQNKKVLSLWVGDWKENVGEVTIEQRNHYKNVYIPTGINIGCSCLLLYWNDFDSCKAEGVDKLDVVKKRRPEHIKYLALSNVIYTLKEQGLTIRTTRFSGGTDICIEWGGISNNAEYKEDDYDIATLKKKYGRLKELNDMANNIIAE